MKSGWGNHINAKTKEIKVASPENNLIAKQ